MLGISLGDLGISILVAMSKGTQTKANKSGGDDATVSAVARVISDLLTTFSKLMP
ncbi:MAG TPA: hypothetical protein V6D15_25230 [Oculatellaceae cyanobacterium]|jgi:hypothetical protein